MLALRALALVLSLEAREVALALAEVEAAADLGRDRPCVCDCDTEEPVMAGLDFEVDAEVRFEPLGTVLEWALKAERSVEVEAEAAGLDREDSLKPCTARSDLGFGNDFGSFAGFDVIDGPASILTPLTLPAPVPAPEAELE